MTHQVSTAAHAAGEMQATLDEWRARALYVVLVVVAIAGLPAYVSPLVNANQITPLLWVYLVVYLAFVGLAVLPRLDVRLRGWGLVLLAYANALASFARVGLAGSGRLYLVTVPVFATILIGSWAGYATAALSLVIYAVFTALAQAGVLSAWLTVQTNPVTLGFWLEAGAALLVFLMILLVLVERFYSLHVQTLAASRRASVELERLNQALKEREERIELVMQGTHDGIWDWNLKTDEAYYSPRWKSMLGYDTHEIEPRPNAWERLVHPDDQAYARQVVQDFLAGRMDKYEVEFRLRHKDGHYVNVLSRAFGAQETPGGPIVRLVGTHVDISERKRVEQALRASEAELRALFAAMTDVILVLDAQGRYLKVAPTNPALLYRPVADLEGKTLHDLFPPPQADFFLDHLRRALESNQPVNLEYSLNLEGRPTWFATTVSPMLADRVIWVARDITERKQAEQALRERLTFEQVITTISTELINLGPDEIDAGILHALQVIGEFTGDDRSYVFRFSEDGTTMDNTHEWCRPNIEPQMPGLQAQPVKTLGWSVAQVKRLEVVHIPRVVDLPAEAQVDREQMQGQGIQSLILVPMVYRGTAVGFVGFDSVRRARTWTDDDIALLRIAGEIFANALEHRRARQALQSAYQTLERRVEERTRELATLNAIAAVVSRSLDLRDILSDALDKTLEITQMGCGGSYRLEGEGDDAYLNPLVYHGLSDEFVRFAGRLLLRTSRVQATADTGQPLVWEVASTPAEPAMKQALEREGVELVVSVPLMAKGRLVGAIQLGARETRAFAPEELALLAAIGQQVGMAVENARLYEQAQQSAAFAERSRLARELHDSVTQSLYSLTLYAEAAARMMQNGEHTQAAGYLREMRDTAQEALREMRLLIFQLRPPALEKSGLAAALQARLDAVESRGGIGTKLRVEGDSGAKPIPLLVQEELYHIAQEALNNALKHAHPTQVQIYLRFDPDAVHLEISDDGAGFTLPSAEESGGLGLPGMRERAERIGADLRLQSTPGQGTKVAVRVPQGSTR